MKTPRTHPRTAFVRPSRTTSPYAACQKKGCDWRSVHGLTADLTRREALLHSMRTNHPTYVNPGGGFYYHPTDEAHAEQDTNVG